MLTFIQPRRAAALLILAGIAYACTEAGPIAPDDIDLNHFGTMHPEHGHFIVCKTGTDGMFDVEIEGTHTMLSLAAGDCQSVYEAEILNGLPTPRKTVTVTELVNAGTQLDQIVVQKIMNTVTTTILTGTNTVTASVSDDDGVVTTFQNSAVACAECKGGVVQLSLQNNGPDANITVVDNKDRVLFQGFVLSGGSFAFVGQDKEGKLGKEIKVIVNGDETKIHTSCSKPIGPGTVFGDFEVVEAFSKDNGRVCPPGDPGTGDCDVGKPAVLVMEYTGLSCAASNNTQDAGKVTCTGDPGLASPVWLTATDKKDPGDSKAKVFFDGSVLLNATFGIDAATAGEDDLKSNTFVHIYTGNQATLLQSVGFHTSCSQPLNVGDVFGSLELVQFTPKP